MVVVAALEVGPRRAGKFVATVEVVGCRRAGELFPWAVALPDLGLGGAAGGPRALRGASRLYLGLRGVPLAAAALEATTQTI